MEKQISQEHYETVLKYMESTGEEDFQKSFKILAQHNFSFQNALHDREQNKNNSQSYGYQNSQSTSLSGHHNDELIEFSGSDVQKLKERLFKQKKNIKKQSAIKAALYKKFQGCFKCFRYVQRSFKKKASYFKKQNIFYFNQIYAKYNESIEFIQPYELESIQQAVKESPSQNRKPFALIISPNRSSFLLQKLLGNQEISSILNKQFYVIGLTLTQIRDLKLHRKKILREVNRHPALVIYNANQFDQLETNQKWMGQQIQKITKYDLQEALKKSTKINQRKKIVNEIQKQFKSIVGRQNQNQLMESYFESNFLTQDEGQYEQYDQDQTHTHTPIQEHKEIIAEQTTLYKEMEVQESIRKKSVQLEKKIFQELLTQREARKFSLAEYQANESQAIQFKFRCPDGKNISKKFNKSERLEILYHFIETHDQIQFENQPQRDFQLFTSYPPKSLGEFKEQQLSKVFEQSIQNIMIRQL